MELIVINHAKIKIMLTKPDMARYQLTTSTMDSANEHTRCAVRHILADADKQVGFDTDGQRLFVQLFASKDGGCEIFVTKLGKNHDVCQPIEAREERLLACVREGEADDLLDVPSDDSTEETEVTTPSIKSDPSWTFPFLNEENQFHEPNRSLTVFLEELPTLLSLCRRLLEVGFSGNSRAYAHESKKGFYLQLEEHIGAGASRIYPFIYEYGTVLPHEAWALYINEHAEILCPSTAVQTLGVL